jgi:hypothetical protein
MRDHDVIEKNQLTIVVAVSMEVSVSSSTTFNKKLSPFMAVINGAGYTPLTRTALYQVFV